MRRIQTLLLVLCATFFLAPHLRAQAGELRGLWVDAWGTGFLNATQTTQLINDCRKYNFNAIFVQMRRRGDAFYRPQSPNLEPRTTAISASYDALADLINKAHSGSPRIEVHCWVTANLIWSATTPPSQAAHVFNFHPEYLMRNFAGAQFMAEGYYLDPGHPDAMLWNYNMARDIVSRYNIDGFHWDYIRYPQQDSGYNPTALARYRQEFNLATKPAPDNAHFSTWRRRQVTDFLRWVNSDLLEIKPELIISAAVFASRTDAFNARFQDWNLWNSEGIIDLCLPMNYSPNNASTFNPRTDDAASHQGIRRVYMGQGAYLNSKENTVTQLNYIRNKGLLGSLFYSYRTPNSGTVNQTATFDFLKANYQPIWQPTPALPWKVSPTRGLLKGTITSAETGLPLYNATITLRTSPVKSQRTEPHGKFAFFEAPAGTYNITATAAGLGTITNTVTLAAGQILNFNLAVPPVLVPIVITGLTRSLDQSINIHVEGNAGLNYLLESSHD